MGTYMLHPRNYVNQGYFAHNASSNRFILDVHDAIQAQSAVTLILSVTTVNITIEFYIPINFKKLTYWDSVARSPPLLGGELWLS